LENLLEDKVALVTGGGSGIGRAAALALSRELARVVVADRVETPGRDTVRMIQDGGGEAAFVRVDVTEGAQVSGLIDTAVGLYGRLDCAFNSAGVEGPLAATADYEEEAWERVLAVNLKGVWLCMKYEIRQMLKQQQGVIVNASSVAGLIGAPNLPAYSASKHGIIGLTKSAALEYAKSGIRVNALCPGLTDTPMAQRITGGDASFLAPYPMGRMAIPSEIAEAVVWLCSDAASFITGHALAVDGGRVAA
jgi:NAD(P)-dependent dehydrogenase (short-subunit alcohol dehydrogenase family)